MEPMLNNGISLLSIAYENVLRNWTSNLFLLTHTAQKTEVFH